MSSQDRSIAPHDKVVAIVVTTQSGLSDSLCRTASPPCAFSSQEIQREQRTRISAQRFFDVASVRYRTGLDPYLNVFTAPAGLLANQLAVITLRVQQITSSVPLIESLGSNVTRLPTEPQVQSFTVLWPFLTQDMRPLTDINWP